MSNWWEREILFYNENVDVENYRFKSRNLEWDSKHSLPLHEPHGPLYLVLSQIQYGNLCLHKMFFERGDFFTSVNDISCLLDVEITLRDFIHSFILSFIHLFFHSSIHSFLHSSIHSFIHSSIRSFIHLFIYSSIHSFIYSFIHLFFHSSILSFIYLFIYSIHSFVHSFVHSFIHLFIHSFIHSFVHPIIYWFALSFINR